MQLLYQRNIGNDIFTLSVLKARYCLRATRSQTCRAVGKSRKGASKQYLACLYQIPRRRCISRLVQAIPAQQHRPVKSGLPPVFTSLIISVLRPMAAIAIIIKNLLTCFIRANKLIMKLDAEP